MASGKKTSPLVALLALWVWPSVVDSANTYTATLEVAKEVPPVAATTKGNATFFFAGPPGIRTAMQYAIDVQDVPYLTSAHIHQGPEGKVGPLIVYLVGPIDKPSVLSAGSLGQGVITNGNLNNPNNAKNLTSMEELYKIVDSGKAYLNIHSVKYPGGVIRGQLKPSAAWPSVFGIERPKAYLAVEGQPVAQAASPGSSEEVPAAAG